MANQYARSVRPEGNRPAMQQIHEVFEPVARKWRGIGEIPASGLALRAAYHGFDAERRFGVEEIMAAEPAECIAGEVLQGHRSPATVRPSASIARPSGRWGRRWSRPKGPAPHITATGEQKGLGIGRLGIRRVDALPWSENQPDVFNLSCPLPLDDHATVQLAHGGGGRLMRGLIEGLFLPAFAAGRRGGPPHDSAVVEIGGARLAFTTDTFVVRPLFFPGGDIGRLAVFGTVNDLAMAGARPLT